MNAISWLLTIILLVPLVTLVVRKIIRKQDSKKDAGWRTLALAGFILAIAARKDDVERTFSTQVPKGTLAGLLIVGFLVGLVGLLALVPWAKIRDRYQTTFQNADFTCRYALESELSVVREMACTFFGDGVTTLERMRLWYKQNANLFSVIHQQKSRRGPKFEKSVLVGYFCLIPLKKAAADAVELEQLDGATILPSHIPKPQSRVHAIYIGAVAADGQWARHQALAVLKERLEKHRERNRVIYTRPVTERGVVLARKYGFVPVDPKLKEVSLNRIAKLTS